MSIELIGLAALVKPPKQTSLSEARRTAESFWQEFGPRRALKRCAWECALARRARSRRRFAFWTEVARLVEAHGDEPWDREAPEAAAVAAAAGIADLLEFFARMAQGVRLPKLAYLLSLARVQAAAEASANVRKPPIPNSSNGGPPPTPDEREVGAPPTRTAHFRAHYENLSRLA